MLCKVVVILIALFPAAMCKKSAPRRFNLEFYNYTCTNYTTRLKVFECSFAKLTLNSFLFTERFMSDRNLGKDVEARFLIQVTPMNGKNTLNFLDVTFNVCNSLSGVMDIPLTKTLFEEMRSTSNFPVSCPLKANVLYHVTNFSITDQLLPQYTPYMNFTSTVDFLEKGKLFGKVIVKGAAIPK